MDIHLWRGILEKMTGFHRILMMLTSQKVQGEIYDPPRSCNQGAANWRPKKAAMIPWCIFVRLTQNAKVRCIVIPVCLYKLNDVNACFCATHSPWLCLSHRFPEPESPSDNCEEDISVHWESRWLSPLSHDLRQLPEAAWLLQYRDHDWKTVDCCSWGPAIFPPFLISSHLTLKCLLQRLMKSQLPS